MKKYLLVLCLAFMARLGIAQESMFQISYNMAQPLGEMNDYISTYSGRGIGLGWRYFMDDNYSLGLTFGWNVFYQEKKQEPLVVETTTITGNQYRYVNSFPIMFEGFYYLNKSTWVTPFIGGGVGTFCVDQRTDMGAYALRHSNWHFGVSPEVGVFFDTGNGGNVYVGFRYNYAVKTKNTIDYSYLGINVGFSYY